jgi:WD40 repeat protein
VLLAAGGHSAQSGRVVLWNIESGRPLTTLGSERDIVLAADLSPDQTKVAVGGPERLIKIYATDTGALLHKMKKHTDWVTAVAFSPNGEILATGDRNGGVVMWDPDTGPGTGHHRRAQKQHHGVVMAPGLPVGGFLQRRRLGEIVGRLRSQARQNLERPQQRVLCVAYSHDGRFVTAGRDGQVVTWTTDGNKAKTCDFSGEPVLRCAFTHDDARVVAADFQGRATLWDAKTGKRLSDLDVQPPPLIRTYRGSSRRPARTPTAQHQLLPSPLPWPPWRRS